MPTVAVIIRGEPAKQVPGCLPMLPNDGGLIKRLLGFMSAAGISDVLAAGHVGGGTMLKFFTAGDAKKVVGWLKAQGCDETEFYEMEEGP
jgi:hypothetical protein